jgi:hypothetical protein
VWLQHMHVLCQHVPLATFSDEDCFHVEANRAFNDELHIQPTILMYETLVGFALPMREVELDLMPETTTMEEVQISSSGNWLCTCTQCLFRCRSLRVRK